MADGDAADLVFADLTLGRMLGKGLFGIVYLADYLVRASEHAPVCETGAS